MRVYPWQYFENICIITGKVVLNIDKEFFSAKHDCTTGSQSRDTIAVLLQSIAVDAFPL